MVHIENSGKTPLRTLHYDVTTRSLSEVAENDLTSLVSNRVMSLHQGEM